MINTSELNININRFWCPLLIEAAKTKIHQGGTF